MIPYEGPVYLQKAGKNYEVSEESMVSLLPSGPDAEWTLEMWQVLLYIHHYQLRNTFNVEVHDLKTLTDQEYTDLMERKRDGLSLWVTLQENPKIAYSILDCQRKWFAYGCTGLKTKNAEVDPRMDNLHHNWVTDEGGWTHWNIRKVSAEHLSSKQTLI